jgi:hypothetical protein
MLPPSSWWLNLVKVDDEVIGIRKHVLYVWMLQGEVQFTTFLIQITLAFAWNQFGRLFLRNVGTTFYHTRTIMQKTIIRAAAVVEARKFKYTLLPIFFLPRAHWQVVCIPKGFANYRLMTLAITCLLYQTHAWGDGRSEPLMADVLTITGAGLQSTCFMSQITTRRTRA